MGLSTEQISAVLNSKAKQLSQPNAIPKSSEKRDMTDVYSKQGDMFLESLGYDNYDDNDPEYQPRKLSEQELMAEAAVASAPAFTTKGIKNSKMPDAIKNMMAKSAIEEQKRSAQTQIPLNENLKAARAIMEKTGMVESKQTNGGNATGIDYSIIKAIVSECLKEYLSDKQPLNEGTIKGIKLKEGKISIIDNKGNIYSAQLQKVGNKNDKER